MSNQLQLATQAELARMSRDELLDRCMALAAHIEGKAQPGEPQYLLTPEGYLMYQRRVVSLTTNGGGLTFIKGVGTIIDSLGWDRINEVLRVHVYMSPNIEIVGNPARAVRVSGVGVGSIGGVPQARPLSLTYEFGAMFLAELVQKVRYTKTAGTMGVRGEKPASWKWCDNNGREHAANASGRPMVFYSIEGDAGVWVDVSHDEILGILKTLQDRRSKPDRSAFTFLRRNIVRMFAGGISQKVSREKEEVSRHDVEVLGYYYPLTRDRLEKIAASALVGTQADQAVECKAITAETVTNADEAAAEEAHVIDTDTGEVVDAGGAPAAEAPTAAAAGAQPPRDREGAPAKDDGKSEAWEDEYKACADTFALMTKEQKVAFKKRFPGNVRNMGLAQLRECRAAIVEIMAPKADAVPGPSAADLERDAARAQKALFAA